MKETMVKTMNIQRYLVEIEGFVDALIKMSSSDKEGIDKMKK